MLHPKSLNPEPEIVYSVFSTSKGIALNMLNEGRVLSTLAGLSLAASIPGYHTSNLTNHISGFAGETLDKSLL